MEQLLRLAKTVGLSVLLTFGGTAPGIGTPAAAEAFVDRLRGLDRSRWLVSHNWANGWEKNNTAWLAKHVRFRPTGMSFSMTDEPAAGRPFTSGELQTRRTYGYGRYEAILKAAKGSGVVTGFFTYTGPYFGDPHDEIDFEFLGKDPTKVDLNYFTDGDGRHRTVIDLGFDATAGFHSYAFVWAPDSIKWFVDGRQVHEERGDRGPLPRAPGKIYAHLWNGLDLDDWLGPFTYPGAPLRAEFRCISYRPLGSTAPTCTYP